MDAPNLDLELTRLLSVGDRKRAATILVERFAADVYALCRAMVRDTSIAEDLSQDAFGRAIAALDGFRGESSPRTWLLKIARNRCLDHLAQTKRAPWSAGVDPEPDDHPSEMLPPLELLANREDAELALASLAETERAIVVLHFGHGVGYAELAEAFGLREGAVRMRVSRALVRMRQALEATAPMSPALGAPMPASSAAPAGPPGVPRARGAPSVLGRAIEGFGRVLGAGKPPPPARGAPPPSAPAAPPAPAARKTSAAPQVPAPPRAPMTMDAGSSAMVPPTAPPSIAGALHDSAPPSLLARLRALAATL